MKDITVFTLIGCGACAEFTSQLRVNNIFYNEVSCSSKNRICNDSESLTVNNRYPKCKIVTQDAIIYVCCTLENEKVGTLQKIKDNIIVSYVYSIDNMLNVILKL
jgi:glutaredoxin-related protein